MIGFLLRKGGDLLLAFCGVLVLVFLLIHLVPGDPAQQILGEMASERDVAALRHELGLDRPLPIQLTAYLGNLLHLDLGRSLVTRHPVFALLRERVGPTLILAASALLFAVLLAVPIGIAAAALRDGPIDRASLLFSSVGVAVPSFFLGPMLLWLLSVRWGLFPTGGAETTAALVLPTITLALPLAASLSRLVRASLLEEQRADYVKVAIGKGAHRRSVLLRHAFPNALLPVVTVFGLQAGSLLTGAIITEQVFAWPGLGGLLMEAILGRDYPVVQGTILLFAIVYILVNALTDAAYLYLDPRVAREP